MGLGRLAALGGWSPVLLVVVVCLPTCQLANLPTCQLANFSTCWRVGGVRQGAGRLGRARRWSPPLVRDGEREQCCGGEERGGAAEGGVLVLVAAAGCCDCIVQ